MRMLNSETDGLLMLSPSWLLANFVQQCFRRVTITAAQDKISISLGQRLSNFSVYQNHLKSFVKHGLMGPTSTVSDSLGLGQWSSRICISNTFPGIVNAVGWGTRWHWPLVPRLVCKLESLRNL